MTTSAPTRSVALHPRQGEVACRAWVDSHGASHILVVAALRPHSFVQRGRFGRGAGNTATTASKYNTWRHTTREQLLVALRASGIHAFRKGTVLAAAVSGGMKREGRSPDVMGHDATDLTKAVEDLFTGLLYDADRCIRWTAAYWADRQADWFSLALWTPDAGGYLRHYEDLDDEAQFGPRHAGWLRGATTVDLVTTSAPMRMPPRGTSSSRRRT